MVKLIIRKMIALKATGSIRLRPALLLLFSIALIFSADHSLHAQPPNLQETLQKCISDLQASPSNNSLREKIIKLAQEMKPEPAIPAEAEKFGNRAEYIIKNAKSNADFADAVKEYEKALLVAPWVAVYYYNLGVASEKTSQLQDAVSNYRLYLLAAPNAQDAQEVRKQIDGMEYVLEKAMSWAADPATGCKIGWNSGNFTLRAASWSGPVVDGKAEGKGTLKVTTQGKDGEEIQGSGEVEMVAGLLEGKGALEWSDHHSYEGYFRAGKRNGKGIMKFADGHIYDGEWKNDEQSTITPIKVDKILGIPWEASEDEAKRIMLQRPETWAGGINTDDPKVRVQNYVGPYNGASSMILVHFYQEKMYAVSVLFVGVGGDRILEQFNSAKQGLSQRYGVPYQAEDKGLDSVALWSLGGVHRARIRILKDFTEFTGGPFRAIIQYFNAETVDITRDVPLQTSGKDY